MKQTRLWALVALTLAGAAGSFASAIDDARITARIETMFMLNRHLSPFNINTTTKDGVVTLSGSVEDEVQKDLAGELADSVDGVKSVNNQVIVMGTVISRKPKRGWRQKVEDKTISASVRTRLIYHKEFRGFRIGVKTENNVVTLFGVVGSEAQKQRIGAIAFDTRGVAAVKNNLTVRPKEKLSQVQNVGRQVSDEWVEKRVETALMLNRHISLRDLNVEVDDGLCMLTGTVDSETQLELAGAIAQSIHGVRQVKNDVRVRPVKVDLEPIEPPP